ncbi:MAG: SIMPL domain-containing protein, partial [Bacteroidia bacterium]|nr:SIMPL domain-containing protein [Bacteroidia bacterium]
CVSCNTTTTTNAKERTIEVIGSADMEIQPDEIFYRVTLQEYKKWGKKISMKELETQLLNKTAKLGIKKEDVKMENTVSTGNYYDYYYYDYYYYHQKRTNYFVSKTFTIKFNSPETIEKFLETADSLNYTAGRISGFDNSNKQAYRDSLKIMALKAAKNKAEMLLSALGEKTGEVLAITEIETQQTNKVNSTVQNNSPYYWRWANYDYNYPEQEQNQTQISNQSYNGGITKENTNAPFKDLKLRYEIKAVFRIKEVQ